MEGIKEFGIQPELLIAQIVNFAVIFYVLKRFAYKPILKVLKDRKEEIELSIKNNELAQKALEDAEKKETKILHLAREQAKEVLDEAKKQAEKTLEESRLRATEEQQKIINDARSQIQEELAMARKDLRNESTKIAIAILNKSLEGVFDEKDNSKFLEIVSKKVSRKIN